MEDIMYYGAKMETGGKWGDKSKTEKDITSFERRVKLKGLSNKCK